MKRLFSVLTVILMLCMLPVTFLSAKADGRFVVAKVDSAPGDTVTVKVSTSDNPGIVSLKVMVHYDTSVLELIDTAPAAFSGVSFGPLTANPIAVNWVDAIHDDNTTNGAIAKLTFRVRSSAPMGKTSITLSYDPDDVYDSSWNNVNFTITNGYVNVTEPSCYHSNTTVYPAKPSTCLEKGNDRYVKCNDCGMITQGSDKKLPLAGHDYEWTVTKQPTCTVKGERTYSCSVCDAVSNAEVIAALGHDKNNTWLVTKQPTVSEPGEKVQKCSRCSMIINTAEIPVLEYKNPFVDVKSTHWYAEAVMYCHTRGYMMGVSEITFAPSHNMTRAMFVQLLANFDGVDLDMYRFSYSGFSDVKRDHWYNPAVCWAVNEGIVSGMSPTTFCPNNVVTRAQLARLLYVYSEKKGINTSGMADISVFPDASKVPQWAYEPVRWAVNCGIISGVKQNGINYLAPNGTATRAQTAVMLMSFDALFN